MEELLKKLEEEKKKVEANLLYLQAKKDTIEELLSKVKGGKKEESEE